MNNSVIQVPDQVDPISIPRKLSRFDIIRGQLQNEFPAGKITHLGKGFFQIHMAAITCTGSDITQYMSIPFRHKLHRIERKHTDAASADCTDAITYSVKYGATINQSLLMNLITVTASTVIDVIHLIPDFWRGDTRYQLISNTTTTDLLYITLVIEVEDEPHKGD